MKMRNDLNNIEIIKDLTTAITHHSNLYQYYTTIVDFEGDFLKSNFYKSWMNVNVHIVDQLWGSTACGWGGMGGAAMTSKYNMIIEHPLEKILFVYWDGRLAYILDNKNDSYDFGKLPSLSRVDLSQEDNTLYKFVPDRPFNA